MHLLTRLLVFVAWLGAVSGPVTAGDARSLVVVELFTSQGCSSCPAADALLARLAARDDVLALALHVDYWDYIGWPDTFARPEHTARQKSYAHAAGMRSIYTPQMIIAGIDHVIGSKPMEVADYIEMFRDKPVLVTLKAEAGNDMLMLEAMATTNMPLPGQLVVMLVRFNEREVVDIRRGENAGRTMEYTNIVTAMEKVADWDGKGILDLALPLDGDDAAAVFLQVAGPGEILAAVRVR